MGGKHSQEDETLGDQSLYELWEKLTKKLMRRALTGDSEAIRLVTQLLQVRPRAPKPPAPSLPSRSAVWYSKGSRVRFVLVQGGPAK
jgi:hypothetical protein